MHSIYFLQKNTIMNLIILFPRLFFCACGLSCGIYSAEYLSLFSLFLSLFICVWSYAFSKKQVAFLTLFAFSLGFMRHTFYKKPKPLPPSQNIYLQGKVLDKTFLSGKQFPFKISLNVEKVSNSDNPLKETKNVHIYSKNRCFCHVDDTILCGPFTIKEQDDPLYARYLANKNIANSLFCEKVNCTLIHRPRFSIKNWIFWQRELIQIKLFKKLKTKTFSLFSSLFMGNKQSVARTLDEFKNNFGTWGIAHYLARSGLHLLLFIIMWRFLCNYLPFSFIIKHYILLLLIFCYSFLSWPTVSFFRALALYIVYAFTQIKKYTISPLHGILATYTIFLLYNPNFLFTLDFQLSFLLSFCLLWLAEFNRIQRIKN